jgi:pimeloyl-ACP methyl ester carboxylesterase
MKKLIHKNVMTHSNATSIFRPFSKLKNMTQHLLSIPVNGISVQGDLTLCPPHDKLVIFAHGSGSSRKSIRNRSVAGALNNLGISTLLFDLLTEEEAISIPNRFNIPKLTRRLVTATNWIMQQKELKGAEIGYFGASTGAAAALSASLECPSIATIVSRGGRPDLVMDQIHDIKIPVLFIVGENDQDVLSLNQKAFLSLSGKKQLTTIPGASHLFEEKGTLEKVISIAAAWFDQHLQKKKRILKAKYGKAI